MSFCSNASCTGSKARSLDITDWGKQCIQGQGLHTGLAQRCQQNARNFCRKGTTLTILEKMMFQLISFLKLRRCMTVILPFCVHTHLMQSQPFVKGAAPKSSSATQWVLMRGPIFFTTCCNLHFFVRKKTIREEVKDEDSWQVPSP